MALERIDGTDGQITKQCVCKNASGEFMWTSGRLKEESLFSENIEVSTFDDNGDLADSSEDPGVLTLATEEESYEFFKRVDNYISGREVLLRQKYIKGLNKFASLRAEWQENYVSSGILPMD